MIIGLQKFKTKSGFTLVEIMIVVFIVALLAALAIPNFTRHTRRAKAGEAIATMSLIRQAMRDYDINNNTHYDVATGNIDNNIPLLASINLATGAVTGANNGVDIDVGVAQYFSNAAFSVDAVNHVSARFTNPGPVDFVISTDGSNSVACGAADCAINAGIVTNYRLEMDNTGRVFISYDGDGGPWEAY